MSDVGDRRRNRLNETDVTSKHKSILVKTLFYKNIALRSAGPMTVTLYTTHVDNQSPTRVDNNLTEQVLK